MVISPPQRMRLRVLMSNEIVNPKIAAIQLVQQRIEGLERLSPARKHAEHALNEAQKDMDEVIADEKIISEQLISLKTSLVLLKIHQGLETEEDE